jgi:D-galactarolactone cycloisomerase
VKITQINGYHLAYTPRIPLGNARAFMRQRNFLALEVLTDSGIRGWGEVFSSPWAAAALIQKQMASQVLGKSPLDHGVIHAALLAGTGYDKRGPSMMAISALDLALHDIAARAQGVSVAQLLGGVIRDRVPVYASGPFIREGNDPYGHYLDDIEGYLRSGFRAAKPRAGITPRADAAIAAQVRAMLDDGCEFMIDINQGYSAAAARQAVALMAPSQPLWVEEPVHPEDLEGYKTVAHVSACPIAGGEAVGSLAGFRDLLGTGGLALLQPDLTVCGGYTGFRKVAALAEAQEVSVLPHAFGTAINFCASLQMAAASPTRNYGAGQPYPWVEYDATGNPLIELFDLSLDSEGMVAVPDGPGTGISLTPDDLKPWVVSSWNIDLDQAG